MRAHLVPLVVVVLAACPDPVEVECGEFEEVFVWSDVDGDGFGRDEPIGYTCAPGPGEATNNADCDDDDPATFPDATGANEVCDLADNDCNGRVDELSPKTPWYHDADADGWGSDIDIQMACELPGSDWLTTSGDCDDTDAAANPGMIEICNAGVDDDCDTLADDADGGVDPTTYSRWYLDNDLDGYGDPDAYMDRCGGPPGSIDNADDCDDDNAALNPAGLEICNSGLDDDCDGFADDYDDSVDPATQDEYFADADGDGYGDALQVTLACEPTPGIGVSDDQDCDDSDPLANVPQDWYLDGDGDGSGDGVVAVAAVCLNPGPGYAPASGGIDCAPSDPAIFPDAIDPCGDGVDNDCSGNDGCGSCQQILDGVPGLPSGVYTIEPTPGMPTAVYCDMVTDGGGWTLVASTRSTTLDDAGTSVAYADLQTLTPASGHSEIWRGLRTVVSAAEPLQGRSDIRFACKVNVNSASFDVDLSFYETVWYTEITTGTDTQSCFNDNNGIGADPPPARTNNLNGAFLAAGNQWAAGYLEGEDSCSDTGDFTVDFDDRGMDNNQADGTDWGEDDSSLKCGTSANGQAWFIFTREL